MNAGTRARAASWAATSVLVVLLVATAWCMPSSWAGGAASSVPMPRGDMAGWSQVFAEDFTADVPTGSFPGPFYAARWTAYDGLRDTSGLGVYSASRTTSVEDGALVYHLHSSDGVAYAAASVPIIDGTWGGLLYGRVDVRFRADPVAGYKLVWILWPDSNDWSEGEIDFAEGELDSAMYVANFCVPNAGAACLIERTNIPFEDWHTATVEWLPDGVAFFIDGRHIATSDAVPSTPMHLVLQAETVDDSARRGEGNVYVDWVSIYSPMDQ